MGTKEGGGWRELTFVSTLYNRRSNLGQKLLECV